MEPMKPMKPMEPMEPVGGSDAWWPKDLGSPSSSGAQDGLRYAVFADKKRLVVESAGKTTTYDTGERRIGGVGQAGGGPATFTDAEGTVELSDLERVG